MTATPRSSWVRRVFGRAPAAPHRRPARRLGCERLEDRVNPADPAVVQLDLAGLRFVASEQFVKEDSGDYFATQGTVGIGYTPAGSEAFLPILQVSLDASGLDRIDLYTVTQPTKFGVTLATINLLPGGTPGVPVPIYKPGIGTAIDIPSLIGKAGAGAAGLTLDPDSSLTIDVAGVTVTPTLLLLDNPNDGDTSDAQAKAQGKVTFEDIPLLSGLGLEADVNNTNYLISDSTGINLTGAVISKTWTIDGVTVAGEIDVGYDRPSATFTMGGGVNVTNTAEPNGKAFLKNVEAQILFSIQDGVLTAFQFQVAGSFTLFETLTVSTQTNEPLVFKYQLPTDTDPNKYFEVGGSLLFQFNDQTIEAELVDSDGNPGVVITNGHLTSFTGTFDVDLHLFGATLSTAPTGGLTVVYQAAVPPSGTDPGHPDRFVIYGGMTFGFAGQTVEASLGTSDAPGFTIVDGSLTELNVGLAAGINAFGLKLNIGTVGDPAMVRWVPADDSFNVSGTFTADFQVFQTRLVLGGTEPPGSGTDNAKGLSIVNGRLSVPEGGRIVFDLEDAVLGPVDLKDLELTYTSLAGGGVDVDVKAAVGLPGGWSAAGEFDLEKDANESVKLETISIELSPAPGALPIGDTGLSVVDIAVKVTNIDTPSQIVVTGDVAVVWGEPIPLLGQSSTYLFRAQGNVLADAQEFVLDATAQFGAYSADGGNTWQGVLGQGEAKLTLDWADGYYALSAEIDGLAGIFDVKGDFVFESGREIAILAEASVVIPQEVPFIGGDTIGGVGFFFQHVFAHDTTPQSTTVAAWIDIHIIWSFTVGFELDYTDGNPNPHFSLIGGDRVAQFEQDVAPPVTQNYTYTSTFTRGTAAGQIAPEATSAVLGVDWSKPAVGVGLNGRPTFQVVKIVNGNAGAPIAEADFAANGISFVTDSQFNTPTSKAIQVVGSTTDEYAPLTADYKLLVTFNTVGGNPFPSYPSLTAADVLRVEATAHVPVPTFGPTGATTPVGPAVPTGRPTAAFPVTVSGNIDEAFYDQARVTLYRVRQNDPFRRGVKVGTLPVTAVTPPTGPAVLAIDAGGSGGAGGYAADEYVTGGGVYQSGNAIDTSKVSDPAPVAVYQNVRTSAGGEFTYTLPGFQPGGSYSVRLHFAEVGVSGPGQRKFNVDINGQRVLTDFDIAAAAGGVNTAYAQSFYTVADANGRVVVAFRNGSVTTTIVSGIEVFQAAGVNWTATFAAPIEGLYAEGYVYYAVIDDGSNPPVQSVVSAPVTPAFAVQGTVGNQNGDPEAGWTAYLDYNGNGQLDPNEPSTVTNAGGFYSFSPTFPNSPGVGPVPVNTPVAVQLLVQGPQKYSPVTMPAVTYTGLAAAVANFALQEFSAIKGTVFVDRNDDGVKDGDDGAAGAVVYLDLNSNGQRDPSDPAAVADTKGNYTFGGVAAGAYAVALDISSLARTGPAWLQTSPNPLIRRVTVAGGGFSLKEGNDFGVLPPAVVSGTVTGHGFVNGRLAADATPRAGVTVNLLAEQHLFAINVGGGAVGNFDPDEGPGDTTTGAAIDTSRVLRPAPQAVYQSAHAWSGGSQNTFTFSYGPGRYIVRLHFAELTAGAPGERRFDVSINGVRVLADYDIVASAGGANTAVVEELTVDATDAGDIAITFSPGSAGDPTVNGIELLQPGAVAATTTTDANGQYSIVTYAPGRYVAQVVPPAGWRQVAPYHSDLQFGAATPLPGGAYGSPLAVADFDGDGLLDPAVAHPPASITGTPAVIWVGYNQGDGTFGRVETLTVPGVTYALQLVAADLDGDGRPDLAVLNTGQTTGVFTLDAYLNTGSAAPGQRFRYVPNFWALPAVTQGGLVSDLKAAELNGDGRPDLLLSIIDKSGHNPAAVVVLVNAAQPGDRAAAVYPLPRDSDVGYTAGGLAVADLNADGHPDVVANSGRNDTDYPNQFNTAFGDGTGALGGWTSYSVPHGLFTGSAAAADVNGDGAADVAVTQFYEDTLGDDNFAQVFLAVNRGTGVLDTDLKASFPAAGTVPVVRKVLLRDVDGDLRPDLVLLLSSAGVNVSAVGSDRVLVYLNSGTAPYFDPANPLTVPIPGGGTTFLALDLLVADFTNDGLADLLVTSQWSGYLMVNTSPPGQPGVAFGLTPGETAADTDLAIAQDAPPAAVQGEVFEDASRNGRRDAGDAGRAGAFVFADLNRNGRHDAGEPSTATVARGLYALPGLAPGSYSVGVVPEDGWHPTTFAEVTVGGSGPARADFARVRVLLGEVGPQAVRVGDRLGVTVPRTAAARDGLVFSLEGDVPAGLTIHPTAGRLDWSPAAEHVGTHAVTVRVRDPLSPTFTETRTVSVAVTAGPAVPPADPRTPLVAVGGPGGVRVFAADGAPRLTLAPFGDAFAGEVRVATGDLTGDGVDDVVAAAGPGGGPHVKAFDGATGAELFGFFAFEPAFAGGVFVAAGDVTGDGLADVVVGAGAGGGPRVRVFDGRDRSLVRDFFAYAPSFAGGVHVAAGDVDGDGRAEVVVGAGAGGGPHVQVFDGRTGGLMSSFFAYDAAFAGGVLVAAGDLDGDGHADVVTSPGAGGGPRVQAFDGAMVGAAAPPGPMADFLAGPAGDRGGARVAVKPAHADRPASVVVGSGDRGEVRAYHLTTPGEAPAELFDLDVFAGDLSGVLVG